jgi:steroid 5-alpha reductase family enzyme
MTLEFSIFSLNSIIVLMGILFVLALIISALGFYKTVWFISIGYAFSIVAMAIMTPILLRGNLTWFAALQNMLFAFWGLRLGIYLLRREMKPSYQKEKKNNDDRSSSIQGWGKIGIWVTVSALYVSMFSPSLFALAQPHSEMSWFSVATQLFGLTLMAGSLLLEAVADKQKSDFKAKNPSQFCNVGLYRWVRCPNYLGEIMIWVGSFIVGITFYASLWQWVVAAIGVVCITLIMMGSTKRLENAQTERYGGQKRYQEYIRSVPVLFPFVPVYSLKNVRVFIE